MSENCAPVKVRDVEQDDDNIFNWKNGGHTMKQNCIPFTRSNPYCYVGYTQGHGPREQFNALTAFLDLSSVYGSEKNISNALRAPPRNGLYGLLLENNEPGQKFNLPTRFHFNHIFSLIF